MTTVKQILDSKGNQVYTISPQATVFEALKKMGEKEVGALAVVDGVYALLYVFRKDVALPNGLLVAYAVLSIALGALALLQPLWLAMSLFWMLAGWLIVVQVQSYLAGA